MTGPGTKGQRRASERRASNSVSTAVQIAESGMLAARRLARGASTGPQAILADGDPGRYPRGSRLGAGLLRRGERFIPRQSQSDLALESGAALIRIEDVAPDDSLSYALSGVHWLDALTDDHLSVMTSGVLAILGREASPQSTDRSGPSAGRDAEMSQTQFHLAPLLKHFRTNRRCRQDLSLTAPCLDAVGQRDKGLGRAAE